MGVNGHWYVEIQKQGFWRGQPHTWVNRYVMSGAQPEAADAQSVIDALHDIETQIHPQTSGGIGVGFVQGRAYPSGKGTFYTKRDYNPTLAAASATGFAGLPGPSGTLSWAPTLETCMLLETLLTGLNSRGKPNYLRKFYRGVTDGDIEDNHAGAISPVVITQINGIVAPFWTGLGTNNYVVIGNAGSQASSAPTVHGFLVAHQIPRGKKKKKTTESLILQLASDAAKARAALSSIAEDALAA